jgi:4-amino-4-deoxy-L-arabinose transferase-like glycosyltransferase
MTVLEEQRAARGRLTAWRTAARDSALTATTAQRAALGAVLVIGAVIRLDGIKQPFVDAFSWRESSVAMIARNFVQTNPNIFYPQVDWSGPGPSYQGRELQTVSYLASLIHRAVGEHEWVGRSVAVAFGLLGILALYLLVRRLWGPTHGLAAAALLALMPGAGFIDRSFLPDPAMVALVVTSAWALVAYLQTDRLRFLVLAAAIGALGFLTKLPGLAVGVAMLYAIVSFERHRGVRRDRAVALGAAAAVVLGVVVAYYLWARHLSQTYPPYHFAGASNWLWSDGLRSWIDQGYFFADAVGVAVDWLWTPAVLALALVGLLFPPPGTGPGRWFFHWWLVGMAVFYALGAKELVDNPWNFHIFDPMVAAFAGRGLVLLATLAGRAVRTPLTAVRVGIVLLVVWAVAHDGVRWLYEPYAGQSRALGLALQDVSRRGELVVTVANAVGEPTAILYSERRGWVFPPPLPELNWGTFPPDADAIAMLDDLRREGATWFGIVRPQAESLASSHPQWTRHLRETCRPAVRTAAYDICRLEPLTSRA